MFLLIFAIFQYVWTSLLPAWLVFYLFIKAPLDKLDDDIMDFAKILTNLFWNQKLQINNKKLGPVCVFKNLGLLGNAA